MAASLSDLQASQSEALTQAYKRQANQEAARIAALIALYYQTRVNVEDPQSVEAWLNLMIPRLIKSSDDGALRAAAYYDRVRRIEVPDAPRFSPSAHLGMIDPGVRKSLLTVGPYDYMNKAKVIQALDTSPAAKQAMLVEAKQVTAQKIGQAVVRHAQAGGRQTIDDNSKSDETALGWVRVTKANPCYFCAMLASRGLQYRAFKEGSFDQSDARFTGDGDAKVHDQCGCSLKPVYFKNDPILKQNQKFEDMWSMWGAGGGRDAVLRFRRGYNHFRDTGEYLTWEQAESGNIAA